MPHITCVICDLVASRWVNPIGQAYNQPLARHTPPGESTNHFNQVIESKDHAENAPETRHLRAHASMDTPRSRGG